MSDYRTWNEFSHADKWLVFPENIGESLCIDEVAMSNGRCLPTVPEEVAKEALLQ